MLEYHMKPKLEIFFISKSDLLSPNIKTLFPIFAFKEYIFQKLCNYMI